MNSSITKKLSFHFTYLFLITFCLGCNAQKSKSDFLGTYRIDKRIPADTTSQTLQKIKATDNWTLSFEKDDNFVLSGTNKKIVGYWDIQETTDKQYRLLLQGAGMAIRLRFDEKTIYFDRPYRMLDDLFSSATFTKQ